MTERLNNSPEHKLDSIDTSAETEKNLERINAAALEEASQEAEITELQEIIEKKAAPKNETKVEAEKNDTYIHGLHQATKAQSYARSLKRIRSKLSKAEKIGSKVVHQPAIDTVSGAVGKTVARPSGILGGGIAALVGSSILLYMAKNYGFQYNFFVFFVLLAAGFVVGLLAELIIRSIAKR